MSISFNRAAFLSAVACLALQGPAEAFHFGVGNAAAAEGAKVVNKANSEYMASGSLLVPRIPSCGSRMALFDHPPVTDSAFVSISPIGHVFPPAHTFPADHAYYNFNASTTAQQGINQYAPGSGWVTQTIALYYNLSAPASYVITYQPCLEVKLDNMSVTTLAPALARPAGPSSTSCSSDNWGTQGVIQSCVTNMEVPVSGGDLLGTGGLVDFGPIEDTRFQMTGFINPARHDLHRGFCPLNYFVPSLRTSYTAILGVNNGSTFIPRTIAPLCGTVMQDLAGTVQGDWYYPSAPNIPENPHLALIHHNVDPSTGTFSVGQSIPGFIGSHDFIPKTTADSTRINYDFSLVTDTQLYCYDTLLIDLNVGVGGVDSQLTGRIVLLQMSGASLDTLKIELQNPGLSCAAAAPWSFHSAAVTFQR